MKEIFSETKIKETASRITRSINETFAGIQQGFEKLSKDLDSLGDEVDTSVTANGGDIIVNGKVRTLVVNGVVITLPESAKKSG